MGKIDFTGLKLKLMSSIVAISAIQVLKAFMDVKNISDRDLAWSVGIHLVFVVSGVLLALTDRLSRERRTGDAEGEGPRRTGFSRAGPIAPSARGGTRRAAAPWSSAGAAGRRASGCSICRREPAVELGAAAVARRRRLLVAAALRRRSGRRGGCGNGSCGRTSAASSTSQPRSAPASRQSALLIAGLTKMRATSGSCDTDFEQRQVLPASRRAGRCRASPAAPCSSPTSPRARARQSAAVRHRRQPDVGVEADLMRGVAGQHRPAARLRDVADEEARPAVDLRHPLARGARGRRSAADGPSCGCARGASPARCRRRSAAPRRRRRSPWRSRRSIAPARGARPSRARTAPCRASGIVRIGERRQRLRVERAPILRERPARRRERWRGERGRWRRVMARH